jgi:hypothetical protein
LILRFCLAYIEKAPLSGAFFACHVDPACFLKKQGVSHECEIPLSSLTGFGNQRHPLLVHTVQPVHDHGNGQEEQSADQKEAELDLFFGVGHAVIVERLVLSGTNLSKVIEEDTDTVDQHIEGTFVTGEHQQSGTRDDNAHRKESVAQNVEDLYGLSLDENILQTGDQKGQRKPDEQRNAVFGYGSHFSDS